MIKTNKSAVGIVCASDITDHDIVIAGLKVGKLRTLKPCTIQFKCDVKFNGILLSYKNLHMLQNVGAIRNDNSDIHFQIQADYFLFCPYVGATLRGVVNKKSITHLGILVHRVFNVVIPRPTDEPGSEWIGTNIEEGQQVVFQIAALDLYGALPYIRGQLDERWLKLEANSDAEMLIAKNMKPLNVTYVNFDKTKPTQKQLMGDDLPSTSTKENSNNPVKHNSPNGQHISNETEMNTPKSKVKRQSKVLETDIKHSEANIKVNKKHKKDG